MKRKRVNLKTVLGFTLATTLALGGLVAADVVINPNTIVAKADEADDIVFDFTESEDEVSQDVVNEESDVVEEPAEETPPAENPDTPTPDPNPQQGSEETPEVTPTPDTPNENGEETENPDENLPGDENEDDPLLPGTGDDITPPEGENENPDIPNPDEHVHSICYTALDETIHILTCTDAECEYTQTEGHSDTSDGLEDGICICGFQMSVIPDNEGEEGSDIPETPQEPENPEEEVTDPSVTDPEPQEPVEPEEPVVSQEEYDKVKEKVKELEKKIKELEKKQKQTNSSSASSGSGTSSQVSNLSNQVSNLQSQNTALQSQNATLNNKNRTMAADILSLQNQVTSLTGKLNSLSNTYAAGNANNSLSQTYDGNKKAQVGDIQNLIDSDTYPAQDTAAQNSYSDTFDGISTDSVTNNEVTFDFTAPTNVNEVTSEEAISESNIQAQTTSVTSETAYAPFNGMPVNSLTNAKTARQRAMAAAATVGSISFTSMIGLYIYGRKKGLLGKKEISIDDLINDEEETGAVCPA